MRDNLFRGVVERLYGHRFPRGSADTSKKPWLERLRLDGVFQIGSRVAGAAAPCAVRALILTEFQRFQRYYAAQKCD